MESLPKYTKQCSLNLPSFSRNVQWKIHESPSQRCRVPRRWSGSLIEWCYKGELPSLGKPSDTVFSDEVTSDCLTRLKLYSPAEKYWMQLLFHLAMDSIISYLNHVDPGPKLVFEKWCCYVYATTPQSSSSHEFMPAYFHHALAFSKYWCNCDDADASQYSVDDLYSLTRKIPDLMRNIFGNARRDKSK